MVEETKITSLLESLERMLTRPAMYFGSVDNTWAAQSYLFGLAHGVSVCFELKPRYLFDIRDRVMKQRGHRESPLGAVRVLKEERFSDEDIVTELILIEIALYKVLLSETAKHVRNSGLDKPRTI